MDQLLAIFENDVIFNVGRAVIYHQKPVSALEKYNKTVQEIRGKVGL